MTPELELPADYPPELLQLRAIEKLDRELSESVMAKTGGPIRLSGLLIAGMLLAGYLDVVVGGFLHGMSRELYTFFQLSMMAGVVAFLGQAILIGRRLQLAHEAKIQALRAGELCPLAVLNARIRDLQSYATVGLEPRDIVAESLREERAVQAARALQARLDQASQQAVAAPALAETATTAPHQQPRRIQLQAE
jgi:hypothetical protein